MIASILVAVDGSEDALRAVQTAADLAEQFEAELTILHVMTSGGSYEVPSGIQEYAEIEQFYITEHDILKSAAEAIVSGAADVVTERGVGTPGTRVEVGPAAETIVDVAERLGVDLIVVGNRGLTGPNRMLTGSVSNKVNHLASCSVLTVR